MNSNESICSLAGHLASPSASLEDGEEQTMTAGFGPNGSDWFASYDRDCSLWKTCKASFLTEWETYSGAWPKQGTMRNGYAYARPTLERHTGALASSSWPTPAGTVINDGERPETWLARAARLKEQHKNGNGAGMPLTIAAALWQTPAADSFRSRGGDRKNEMGLDRQARYWSTPRATDGEKGDPNQSFRSGTGLPLPPQAFRHHQTTETDGPSTSERVVLNPQFVEALQGFPIGWTDLED